MKTRTFSVCCRREEEKAGREKLRHSFMPISGRDGQNILPDLFLVWFPGQAAGVPALPLSNFQNISFECKMPSSVLAKVQNEV